MIEIAGKQYELVEMSARKYQALTERCEKELGDSWENSVSKSAKYRVWLLMCCLKGADGAFISEEELLDISQRLIIKYFTQAISLGGVEPINAEILLKEIEELKCELEHEGVEYVSMDAVEAIASKARPPVESLEKN
jgi:hypothetical protein